MVKKEEEVKYKILSSEKVDEILKKEEMGISLKRDECLWYKNIPGVRKAGFNVYEFTDFELGEIAKCSQSVEYFADNYCHIKTESGKIQQMKLRPYQREFLRMYDNEKYVLLMCSRQMGKTIVSSIYILWFLLFKSDKNVLVYGNTLDTVKANVEKIKDIYLCLPFFLKRGVVTWNEKNITFENRSRLKGVFKNLVGKAIDLLYIDEFAKFDDKDIRKNYGTIFPTISSIGKSKIFITSTPDGYNFFWELYTGSLKPDDDATKQVYKVKTVKWHEFPSRRDTILYYSNPRLAGLGVDLEELKKYLISLNFSIYDDPNDDKVNIKIKFNEADENTYIKNIRKLSFNNMFLADILKITNWQEQETIAIGGEDMFKQEYDLEFLSGDKLLFDSIELERIKSNEKPYTFKNIKEIEKRWSLPYNQLKFIDDETIFKLSDIKKYNLMFSIDLAEGLNLDYTVINIFKIGLKSIEDIERNKIRFKNKYDFFQLEQVGLFRSNSYSVEDVAHLLYLLAFEVCNIDNVSIVLERNKYGEELLLKLPNVFDGNNNFSNFMFMRFKKNIDDKTPRVGLNVTGGETGGGKKLLVKEFQDSIKNRHLKINEITTILELSMFGKKETSSGNITFKAQSGHDDIIMSCVNICAGLKNVKFKNVIDEMYDRLPLESRNLVSSNLKDMDKSVSVIDYDMYHSAMRNANNQSSINYNNYENYGNYNSGKVF